MIYTARHNKSESDMRTFARVSRPKGTPTNTSGYLRVLLNWFNMANLCHRMAQAGMLSDYSYRDPRNMESEDLAVRLSEKRYLTPYNPREVQDSLLRNTILYMEAKEQDCGFDVWCFSVVYTYDTNTLELRIDESMFTKEPTRDNIYYRLDA